MYTLKHRYSGLITKGLGLPACAGMITLHFGVVHVRISPPNVGGGGGGHIPVKYHPVYNPTPMMYTPMRNSDLLRNRSIQISVKFSDTKTWRQSYYITDKQANSLVKLSNLISSIKKNINITVSNLKRSPLLTNFLVKFKDTNENDK